MLPVGFGFLVGFPRSYLGGVTLGFIGDALYSHPFWNMVVPFGVLVCFGVFGGGGTDRSRLPRNLRIKYKSPELGLNLNGS